jgi:hypothetical protein
MKFSKYNQKYQVAGSGKLQVRTGHNVSQVMERERDRAPNRVLNCMAQYSSYSVI